MGAQDKMNNFYDPDNLVTVKVVMPKDDWEALRNADPRGGFGYKGPPPRYDFYKTTSVTISGSKFPQEKSFPDVGIVKKSFGGSKSNTKPSLRLNFTKYNDANEDGIEKLIGAKNMILNNSIQDKAYIRQPLGYELFRQAGVPSFRCNLATVFVNDEEMGVYVNLEPVKKRFLENRFGGNTKGNAYEIEAGEDLTLEEVNKLTFEGFSKYEDKKDIQLAAQHFNSGVETAQNVIDVDAFLRFYTMETCLKHWDGYTQNLNNTYIYNDTTAIADPQVDNVKIRWIPSGIDQILPSDPEHQDMYFGEIAIVAKIVLKDETLKKGLLEQLRQVGDSVFGEENIDKVVIPFIGRLEDVLTQAGFDTKSIAGELDAIKNQVRIAREECLKLIENTQA